MKQLQPIIQHLSRLFSHISSLRRRQFLLLLLLMILASFAEVLSIGAVLPLLAVLTEPQQFFEHSFVQPFIEVLGIKSADQLLLPMTVTFGLAALFAGVMRLILLWVLTRLAYATGADLTISVYRRTLYQSYSVHVARNSSNVINAMATKVNITIQGTIIPVITIISSGMMLLFTLTFLLVIETKMMLIAFCGFGLIYVVNIIITSKILIVNSQRIADENTKVIKLLQEGLGGIRDILLDGTQELYCKLYRKSDIPLRRAQGTNVFLGTSTRFAVEALAMFFLAFVAYFLALQPGGINQSLPVIGVLVLGAQRLLPLLQQGYASWSSIQSSRVSVADTLDFLEQPMPEYSKQLSIESLPFQKEIQLKQISFRYESNSPWVLKDINLTIEKGSRVGFIGSTGGGKSTLIDIVMCLLQPEKGCLVIDAQAITLDNFRSWQKHIAHVPQSIFLADASIEENIAFGIPKDQIDFKRVKSSAKKAQIAEIIETWPMKYQTNVGERGVMLSGGQRQRIGIARALYKRADVLIFDEATSALDDDTEQEVMQAINNLSDELTIIMIAHRLTTLKNCTKIVELGDSRIRRIGNYQDIVSKMAV